MYVPGIVVVTRKTQMEGLVAQYGTRGQAKFRMAQAALHEAARSPQTRGRKQAATALAFASAESEDEKYQSAIGRLEKDLNLGLPVHFIDRGYLPNYDFGGVHAVIV